MGDVHRSFEGRTALITGGTGGVGLRIARRFAERGATVVVNGRSSGGGERALVDLHKVSTDVHFVAGDCCAYSDARSVVAYAAGVTGRLDVLVSAGAEGSVGPTPFARLDPEQIEEAFLTRLMPRLYPLHAAIDALRANGGSVVLLTTDAARHPTPGESIMGAVGASIMLMTKALAKEFTRYGIRVNAVAMTITSDTPSWDRIFATESFQRDLFSKAIERFPLGRPPTADEVAAVATFLASGDAGQVTGQTVSVNGGLSFGGW